MKVRNDVNSNRSKNGYHYNFDCCDIYSRMEDIKEAIKERDELQGKVNELSGKVNDLIIENNKVQERIVERTYKEIEKPIYKECILPKSGVDLRNEQIRELNKSIRGETPRVEP
jgi:hypothetical protein